MKRKKCLTAQVYFKLKSIDADRLLHPFLLYFCINCWLWFHICKRVLPCSLFGFGSWPNQSNRHVQALEPFHLPRNLWSCCSFCTFTLIRFLYPLCFKYPSSGLAYLQVSRIIWLTNRVYYKKHLLDATQIFRVIKTETKVLFVKLFFYLVCFCVYLFYLILAAIGE